MAEVVQLNDQDIAYLLALLRNSAQPLTTQQLVDALRRKPGQGGGDVARNRHDRG